LLIADDQPHILEALELLLKPEGFHLLTARSPAQVLETLAVEQVDGILIDLNYTRDTTSGREGLDLIAAIRAQDSQLPIIVMTAWANIDLAVEAMRRGARDFIQKPWDNARLLTVVRTQLELHSVQKRAQWLEAENRILRAEGAPEMIATAACMRPVVELLARIGPSDANVLVTGEHGTGKEVIAQSLHRLSQRAHRPIVAVNTGALPEGTFESELFGHIKGAFTDARADRIGRFELANGSSLKDDGTPLAAASPQSGEWRQIVGVVADSRNDGLEHPTAPAIYVPYSSFMWDYTQLFIRTANAPLTSLKAIRTALSSVSLDQPTATEVDELEVGLQHEPVWAQQRLFSILFSFFAGLALVLSLVGIASTVSFAIARRTKELGIRMALVRSARTLCGS
jgi:CheY-like chemotaxis protein